ncbi:MAG: DUF5671 domain-containing protein [Patescibacteria group bacterium]
MESLSFLAPLLGFSGVAVVVLAIVAIVQDLKQERKYGYRQAFYTIVTLVMLVMAVGAVESLMVVGLKEAMPDAKQYNQRFNQPPGFYVTGETATTTKPAAPPPVSYTCETDCQFTATDKQALNDWRASYTSWRETTNVSLQTRRNIAGALSLLIIALPLLLLFMRWMNRGAREEYAIQHKPSPLRSIYFYGISFAGLVVAVVGGAFLLNTAFNTVLKTGAASNSRAMPISVSASDTGAIDSVLACGTKCNFSQADLTLAQEWKRDWQKYRDLQTTSVGSAQNDLANTIPLILVGLPLFWYHFVRIRREGHESEGTPTAPTPTIV